MENTLLNLIPSSYIPEVHLSQYDIGRELTFKLMDGNTEYSVPGGATVTVEATKPSGLGFVVSGTFSDNIVTIVNTETMTNESGRFSAELSISSGATLLGTSNFIFNVERSPHPEGTTDGDIDAIIPEFTLLVEEARALVERAEESAESVTELEPRVSANENAINKLSTYVTPEMFGAKGDGIADDANAFSDAIDYAKDNNCYVFVPAGTYLITKRLNCYDGTTIVGESVEKSTILLKREDATIIYLFDAEGTQNVLFKNLHIKGYKTNDQPASTSGNVALYGIKFGGEHAQIEGCTFEGFTGSAVSIRNANDVLISGCTFVDNNTNGIACTRNLGVVRIVNNYFHNNHYHNINFEDASPEYIVNDVIVSDNIIDCDEDASKMAQWGINFAAPSMQSSDAKYNNIVVANNLIKYVATGINMTFTKNAVLESNIISNCSNYGINMSNSAVYVGENIKVINNIINNCDLASLIQYINNLDYSHNTIRHTVKWGARFYYIKNSKIANNFVDNVIFATSGSQVSYAIELILNTGDVYNVISDNLIKTGTYGINVYGTTADIDIYLVVKNNYFTKETKGDASTLQYCVCHENTLKNTIIDGNVAVGSPTMFRDRGSSTNVFQRNNQGFAN